MKAELLTNRQLCQEPVTGALLFALTKDQVGTLAKAVSDTLQPPAQASEEPSEKASGEPAEKAKRPGTNTTLVT